MILDEIDRFKFTKFRPVERIMNVAIRNWTDMTDINLQYQRNINTESMKNVGLFYIIIVCVLEFNSPSFLRVYERSEYDSERFFCSININPSLKEGRNMPINEKQKRTIERGFIFDIQALYQAYDATDNKAVRELLNEEIENYKSASISLELNMPKCISNRIF